MDNSLLAIGVMTGNSLDGADVVLTEFTAQGKIRDLCTHFLPFDASLYEPIRALQKAVATARGDMRAVADSFKWQSATETLSFDDLQDRYIQCIAQAVKTLIEKAKNKPELSSQHNLDKIDVIGLHGQTCDHCPPSRIGEFDASRVYTVQIGNGQQLADLTNITVIYDFRSDDLIHGGEAAPLAPIHNQHLADHTKQQGHFPIAFCNAGNTGNIALITHEKNKPNALRTLGWDAGPFNHYPDLLIRTQHPEKTCDINGEIGSTGAINTELLAALFDHAVQMENGQNYLQQLPPKSGDPNYYKLIPALQDDTIAFADRLRTAEYFSAYAFVHSLSLTPDSLEIPTNFATFGGGWLNPICLAHFKELLNAQSTNNPILPAHRAAFNTIWARLSNAGKKVLVDTSSAFGFDGQVMEARIFADMARCRLIGKPFSTPDTTGAQKPIVGGIIRYPQGDSAKATDTVRSLLKTHEAENITMDIPDQFDPRWSRAAAGWREKLPG